MLHPANIVNNLVPLTVFYFCIIQIMKRLLSITLISILSLQALTLDAQKKSNFSFEAIYRPVFGYLIDTLTNEPYRNAYVYAFDSIDDARLGEEALKKSRNPLTLRLKGDVVETRTDDTGRYMVPARSNGALILYLKDKKEIYLEEIAGRSEISKGRRPSGKMPEIDLAELLGEEYGKTEGRIRDKGPKGVVLDMDFKAYIPHPGDKGKDARVVVERRIVDLESGEPLSKTVPVVRDGKALHKQRRKMIAKGQLTDTLYEVADVHPVLSDSTTSIRVTDHIDTDPWKDRCFRLGYYVSMEHKGVVENIDTLYMMTNRINKPLKYLEYSFAPYRFDVEETTEKRRNVTRRLVLEGEYDGMVPEVLKDSSYVLHELHVKATVAQDRAYDECITLADTMIAGVMRELRTSFAGKLNENVRITKTSQVNPDTAYRNNVIYRYVFRTGRQFSRNDYLLQIKRAKESTRVERLCRQAMEERRILEGTSWDYAANTLAALYMDQGRPDASLLVPFIDRSMGECDVRSEDPVTFEETVMNRREIVANQVVTLMYFRNFSEAAVLSQMLPDEFSWLKEVALCKAGKEPSDKASKELLRKSSLRNDVLMDMLSDNVGKHTLEKLDEMSEDDAMAWYLRARTYCMMYENESWEMQAATIEGSGQTVYSYVLECLKKALERDPSLVPAAKYDSEINEYALKEVLGVYVL